MHITANNTKIDSVLITIFAQVNLGLTSEIFEKKSMVLVKPEETNAAVDDTVPATAPAPPIIVAETAVVFLGSFFRMPFICFNFICLN
jgi:hypothetical protein